MNFRKRRFNVFKIFTQKKDWRHVTYWTYVETVILRFRCCCLEDKHIEYLMTVIWGMNILPSLNTKQYHDICTFLTYFWMERLPRKEKWVYLLAESTKNNWSISSQAKSYYLDNDGALKIYCSNNKCKFFDFVFQIEFIVCGKK